MKTAAIILNVRGKKVNEARYRRSKWNFPKRETFVGIVTLSSLHWIHVYRTTIQISWNSIPRIQRPYGCRVVCITAKNWRRARAEICLFHADVPRDFLKNYPLLLEFHWNRLKQTRKEIFVVSCEKFQISGSNWLLNKIATATANTGKMRMEADKPRCILAGR